MGCILNRFDKLMELKEENSFGRYKLVAVIAHDPKDENLCSHLKSHFLKFAKMTGENFLFITFIQPSKEYQEALQQGKFPYAKFIVSEDKSREDTIAIINPLLRRYYGLPKNGSYMVIAKHLSDNEIYRVKITKNSLPYQLLDLAEYCDNPENFDGLIKSLEGEAFNVKELLAESLLKLVSLISPSPRIEDYSLYYWAQRETAIKTIKEEKQSLLDLLKHSSQDEDLTNKVIELYRIIEFVFMNVLNEGKPYTNTIERCKNFNLLDKKSRVFWNTYSRLSSFLPKQEQNELDYSAFILYLGKIVETELNLSVCQMLRHAMGVDMPDFYNRYCSSKDKLSIPTTKQEIPLNKFYKEEDGKKKLEGVPLGNLLHAYNISAGKEISPYIWHVPCPQYLVELPDEMLSFWENFAKVRNDAAHSKAVSQDLLVRSKLYFQEFSEQHLETVHKLKCNLHPKPKNFNHK